MMYEKIKATFLPINKFGQQLVSHTTNLHLSVIKMGQEELSMENQQLLSVFISGALTNLLQKNVEYFFTYSVKYYLIS